MYDIREGNIKDIDIQEFFQFLSSYCKKSINVFNVDHVSISHLTTRLSLESITNEPLYNLSNTLINDTELSRFCCNEGLVFTKEKKTVKVIYNGEKVNWKEYDTPIAQMIINRLEGNRVWKTSDNCINGFLFYGKIYENDNVRHILRVPEILDNIFMVLGKQKVISEYVENSKPYVITFKVPISDIVFDENGNHELNNKQKKFLLLKYCLYYLSMKFFNEWSENDNPIIRLNDSMDIDNNNLSSIYEVNVNEGKLNKLDV